MTEKSTTNAYDRIRENAYKHTGHLLSCLVRTYTLNSHEGCSCRCHQSRSKAIE